MFLLLFFSIAFRFVSPPSVLACEVAVAFQHATMWLPARAEDSVLALLFNSSFSPLLSNLFLPRLF